MPTIVTATELRTILGVSSSLYSDAYLGDIVDASENLVLPMLVTFQSKIIGGMTTGLFLGANKPKSR